VVPVVGLGRFLRLFRAILTLFRILLKPTLLLPEPIRDLQFADDFADSEILKYLNLLYLFYG
jgi:hypothetical protein